MRRISKNALAAAGALATGLVSLTANGAAATSSTSTSSDSAGLTEIVVTAEKRSESLQNVPVSVTALSADQLARASITSIDDLQVAVPGLQVQEGAGYLLSHLRGVGATTAGAGLENPVALYVDGVYYANQTVSLFSFNNISQIEVLKGPQGTLFGRNATGGLIQINTVDPTQDFQMKVDAGASNLHGVNGDLYIGGGIAPNLAADFAIIGSRMDGYGTNLYNGEGVYAQPFNIGARSKWVYTPDGWKITLIGDYSNTDNSYNSLAAKPGTYIVYPFVPAPALGSNPWNTDTNVQPSLKIADMGGSLKIEHDMDSVTLSNLIAGRRSTFQSQFDDDVTPLPFTAVNIHQADYQISDEFQLASAKSGSLKWVTGIYYFYAQSEFNPTTITLGPTPALNPAYPLGQIVSAATQVTSAIAGFGQLTYSITDQLDLTAGLRYSHEDRKLNNASQNGVLLLPTNPVVPLGPPIADTSKSFDDPTYRLALDYRINSNVMVYGSFNTGFKSGGYNVSNPTDPPFDQEKIFAYEIGEKAEMLDRKLRWNSAAFYYNYENIQIQKPEIGSSGIINGAKATIYGLDSELTAIPLPQLELSASVSLLHTKFDSFPNAAISTPGGGVPTTIGSVAGNQLPYSPEATFNISATYHVIPSLSMTALFYHSVSYYTEPDNVQKVPAFNKINASVQWTSTDEHYWIRLYGDNIANEAVSQFLTTPGGIVFQVMQPGRTYGFKVGYKY